MHYGHCFSIIQVTLNGLTCECKGMRVEWTSAMEEAYTNITFVIKYVD